MAEEYTNLADRHICLIPRVRHQFYRCALKSSILQHTADHMSHPIPCRDLPSRDDKRVRPFGRLLSALNGRTVRFFRHWNVRGHECSGNDVIDVIDGLLVPGNSARSMLDNDETVLSNIVNYLSVTVTREDYYIIIIIIIIISSSSSSIIVVLCHKLCSQHLYNN